MNQQGAGFPVAPYRSAVPPRGQPPVVRSMPSARPITGQQQMGPQAMTGRPLGMPAGGPVMPQPRPAGFKFTPAMRNPPSQVSVNFLFVFLCFQFQRTSHIFPLIANCARCFSIELICYFSLYLHSKVLAFCRHRSAAALKLSVCNKRSLYTARSH